MSSREFRWSKGPEWARDALTRGLSLTLWGGFLLYYGLLCFRHAWAADFQMYLAGASRLYVDLYHPGHEALSVPTQQSSVYTPFLVLVAGLGKLAGVTPYRALQVAGLCNLALYALSVRYFFSRHSLHYRSALPAACFLVVSLCVRWEHFGWSSETSLTQFQYVQAYPSTLAWSLAFFTFGLCEDIRRRPSWGTFALLSATLTALVTCHVLTASWVLTVCALLALHGWVVRRDWRPLALVAQAIVLALSLAAFWPYAPLFGQPSSTAVPEPSHFGERPLHDFANLYLLALPCALWLGLRLRRHAIWMVGFVATYVLLAVWRYLGVSFGNRYSFFMGFFAQFLVAETIAVGISLLCKARVSLRFAFRPTRDDQRLTATLAIAAFLAPLPSPMLARAFDPTSLAALRSPLALLSEPSPHDQYYRTHARLAFYLGPRDVVMAPTTRDVFDIAATTRARFVSAPGTIKVPDYLARMRATQGYFRGHVSGDWRSLVAARYGANRVLLPSALFGLLPELRSQLGPEIFRDDRLALFRVDSRIVDS